MERMEEDRDSPWDFVRDFDCKTGEEKLLLKELKKICQSPKYLEGPELAPPSDCVARLVNIFCKCDLRKVTREFILQALVPWGSFDEEQITPLMLWLFSVYQTNDVSDTLLYWFSMMIEYKKVDVAPILKHYKSLIRILLCPARTTSACKLLIGVTQQKHVSKYTVHLVSKCYALGYSKPSIAALLNLYKTFTPNLISVNLPSSFSVPKTKIKSSIESTFRAIKLKNINNYNSYMNPIELQTPAFNFSKVGTTCQTLTGGIPAPIYLDNSPGPIKFTDVSSYEALGHVINRVVIPSNTASLLSSRIGLMIVWLRKDLEARFVVDVKWALESNAPREAPSHLLERLVAFQEYLRVSLPPVSRYLADTLPVWDGLHQRRLVLQLLPWIHFDTFQELNANFLVPLHRVFFTAETELKVEILKSLQSLITNMVAVHLERAKHGVDSARFGVSSRWIREQPLQIIHQLVIIVEKMIKLGLLLEMEHSRISPIYLNEALVFYHSISILEVKFSLGMWSIVPWYLLLTCIMVRNMSCISLLCSLLVRYKKVVIPHLDSMGILDNFGDSHDNLTRMCRDVVNFLWKGQVLSEGHVWDLLNSASPNEIAWVGEKVDLDSAFSVKIHTGLSPMVHFIATKLERDPRTLTDQDWLTFLEYVTEDVSEFIKEYS